jgi:hypothetical protein
MKTEGQLKSCKNDMEGALRALKQAVRLAHANPQEILQPSNELRDRPIRDFKPNGFTAAVISFAG